MSNVDWCCRTCKGADGQPWRNWGSKSACHKCKVLKGQCLKHVVPKSGSPTTRVDHKPGPGKDDKAQKLAKEVDRLKGEVAKLRGQADSKQAEPDDEAEVEDHPLDFYIHQRAECKAGTKLADFLDQHIKEKREAKQQLQPGSVKLSKADRQVGVKRQALEGDVQDGAGAEMLCFTLLWALPSRNALFYNIVGVCGAEMLCFTILWLFRGLECFVLQYFVWMLPISKCFVLQ